jgi:purine-cytosine permease-like protein
MEEKSFTGYLLDKFNLIGGIIGFIVTIIAFVKTHKFWESLSCFLFLLVLLLIYSLYQLFNNVKTLNNQVTEKNQLLEDTTQKSYDSLRLSKFKI